MTAPITPDPGIHQAPRYNQTRQLISAQQLATWALSLPMAMMRHLVTWLLTALEAEIPAPLLGPIEDIEAGFAQVESAVHSALTTIPQGNVAGLVEALENAGQALVQALLDAIANALGHPGTGHTSGDVQSYLEAIPGANIVGALNTAVTVGETAIGDVASDASSAVSQIEDTVNNAINGAAATTTSMASAFSSAWGALVSAWTGQTAPTAAAVSGGAAGLPSLTDAALQAAKVQAAQAQQTLAIQSQLPRFYGGSGTSGLNVQVTFP